MRLTRRDQWVSARKDLCKIIDTAKQSGIDVFMRGKSGFDFGTDTKSGSARFWNTHQPAYPELGLESPERCEKLHFFPPYAPHLNPIERFWAVMHMWVKPTINITPPTTTSRLQF